MLKKIAQKSTNEQLKTSCFDGMVRRVKRDSRAFLLIEVIISLEEPFLNDRISSTLPSLSPGLDVPR